MCQGTMSKSERRTPISSRGHSAFTRSMSVVSSRVRPAKSPPQRPGRRRAERNSCTR